MSIDTYHNDAKSLHTQLDHPNITEKARTSQLDFLSEGIFREMTLNPEYDIEDVRTFISEYKKQFPDFVDEADALLDNVEEKQNRFENAVQKLSEQDAKDRLTGTELSSLLASVIIELLTQQRSVALDSRLNARTAARGEMLAQADDMRTSADKTKGAALSQSVTSLIFAAVSLGCVGVSVRGAGKTTKSLHGMQKADVPQNPGAKLNLPEGNMKSPSTLNSPGNSPSTKGAKLDADSLANEGGKLEPGGKGVNTDKAAPQKTTADLDVKIKEKPPEVQKPLNDANGKKSLDKDETVPEKTGADNVEEGTAGEIDQIQMELYKAANNRYQAIGGLGQTSTAIGGGIAGLIAMDDTQDAKIYDSYSAEHAAEAEEIKGEGDVVRDIQGGLTESMKALTDFLKREGEAEAEDYRALTRNA